MEEAEHEFVFHSDAAHGWLQVPVYLVKEIGYRPTACSYIDRRGFFYYLEEDEDTTSFLRMAAKAGISSSITERNHLARCFIRSFPNVSRLEDKDEHGAGEE